MCVWGGGGLLQNGRGGGVKSSFTPTEKGAGKALPILKREGGGGGGHNSFSVVLTQELDVLSMLKGECKKVSTL